MFSDYRERRLTEMRARACVRRRRQDVRNTEDWQRNRSRSATSANLKRIRQSISDAVSHPGNIDPAIKKLSADMDGTLDRAVFFFQKRIFCANQFAYHRERKARDVLACIVLTRIHGFHDKLQFLLYCSGLSGAFELVNRDRLLAQLWARECLRSLYEFSTHNYKSAKQKS